MSPGPTVVGNLIGAPSWIGVAREPVQGVVSRADRFENRLVDGGGGDHHKLAGMTRFFPRRRTEERAVTRGTAPPRASPGLARKAQASFLTSAS